MTYAWLTPHLSPGSWVVVGLLVIWTCVVMPMRGRRWYRRLARDRAAGIPGALVRRFRTMQARQALLTAVTLILVAADGGLTRADVGLVLPSGPNARHLVGYTVALCLVVMVSGVVFRRMARRGRVIPGQAMVRALIPDTARERRWGCGVALGAGVSEELLFRGLFTAAVVAAFGRHVEVAALVVSVVFGLCHAYQGWRGVVLTALAGGIMSYVYLGSRSLLLPVVLHVAIDVRSMLVPMAAEPIAAAPAPVEARRAPRPVMDARAVDVEPPRLP